MKNKIGALSVSLALAAGCVGTVYKIDAPDSKGEGAKYALKTVSGVGANVSNVGAALRADELSHKLASADGSDVLPLEITVQGHDLVKDRSSLNGLLWLCTVGIVPLFESDYIAYDVTVNTPAGTKSDQFKITRKSWCGWIPILMPYPSTSDMRNSSTTFEPGDLVYKGIGRTAIAMADGIDYKGYLVEKQRKDDARKTENVRIDKRRKEIQVLLDKHDWKTVISECDIELSRRASRIGSISEDDAIWNGFKKIAQGEIDKIAAEVAAKEAAKNREVAEAASNAAKAEVKRLTDAGLYDEALTLCRQRSKESKKAKDRRFWDDMASQVRTERKIAEKKESKAKEAQDKIDKEKKLVEAQQKFDAMLRKLDEDVKSAIKVENFAKCRTLISNAEIPSELFGIETFVSRLSEKKAQLTSQVQQAEARELVKKAEAIDIEALIAHADGWMTSVPPQSDLRNIVSWYRSRLCALKIGQLKTEQDKSSMLVGAVLLKEVALTKWALDIGASANAISEKDSDSRQAIIFAASNGDVELLTLLNNKGANVKTKSASGETPVMAAAAAGQENAFDWLVEHGAELGGTNGKGLSTLMLAAIGGNTKIVLELVGKGAKIDERGGKPSDDVTALICAIRGKKINIIEKLLELGADPNFVTDKDNNNQTLRAAIATEDVAVLNALLSAKSHGKSLRVVNSDVAYAIEKTGQTAIVKTLLDNGATSDTDQLLSAVIKGKTEIIDLLCQYGADVNGNADGLKKMSASSVLEVAVRRNDMNCVKKLVELGADVAKIDLKKIDRMDRKIQDYLISKGCPISEEDKTRWWRSSLKDLHF